MDHETSISAAHDHHNGPRTFATSLRDGVALTPEILARLTALDTARHPTLSEMRARLGLDLDLDGAGEAARNDWPGRGTIPDDDDLASVLDAMYRSMSSTRLVRVEIGAAGLLPSRAHEPIVIREEEHLHLLAFGDNTTDASVEFSAEAHGEGIGGFVEPRRTGSALLDAGAMHAGSYLLPVMVVADGRPATLDLPIECRPSGMLHLRIIDEDSGEPVAARLYLTDAAGPAWPDGFDIRRDVHGNAWFHADGVCDLRISGTARIRVARGIEYERCEEDVRVPADGTAEATLRLRRWSNMAADGWYSGDVHVHLHYGGEYLLEPEDAALAQRAEDVNFLNMMVANQGSGWVHDSTHFEGQPHTLSSPGHILQWGEEYRNDFYGHMCMYGISALIPPIYSGFALSEHSHDLPANADAARACRAAGGTLSYAHPMFDSIDLDRIFARRRTVEAKELPVDAALGLIDAVDVMSYPGHELHTAALWYRLLNCGLRLAATAGTDTFMNYCDSGAFSNPPAGDRVYVQVEGPLDTAAWCAGVRAGRTFVTNGPMLSLAATMIDPAVGAQPAAPASGAASRGTSTQHEFAPGGDIAAAAGQTIRITAEAGSYTPMQRIEIIIDGEIVAAADATADGRTAAVTHDLNVTGGSWIAARAVGAVHDLVLDRHGLFAHTSPIYVTVPGAPLHHPDDAAYFDEWIERLIDMSAGRGSYPDDDARDAVLATFREGQSYYTRLSS